MKALEYSDYTVSNQSRLHIITALEVPSMNAFPWCDLDTKNRYQMVTFRWCWFKWSSASCVQHSSIPHCFTSHFTYLTRNYFPGLVEVLFVDPVLWPSAVDNYFPLLRSCTPSRCRLQLETSRSCTAGKRAAAPSGRRNSGVRTMPIQFFLGRPVYPLSSLCIAWRGIWESLILNTCPSHLSLLSYCTKCKT